jgi:hypothetical protein
MAYNKNDAGNSINEEQISAYLSDVLSKVESDSDPETLNQLKKIFKKNIPFSRRMYVAAWLVKQANGGYRGSRFGRNDRNDRSDKFSRDRNDRGSRNDRFNRNERGDRNDHADRGERNDRNAPRAERNDRADRGASPDAEHVEHAPRVQIDPSLATTIFIGIGRNRRVYPRDLVGLLVSVAGLDRERIGDIRVLANYSFIQLFTEDCEKAIAALNGYDYRGRKLSVSYSRQKEEGDAEETDSSAAESSNEATAGANSNEGAAENVCATESPVSNSSYTAEESIPAGVSNDSHSVHTESNTEAQIAAEQKAYAAEQKAASDVTSQQPFAETSDDGQVKSHFSSGDAN